MELVLDMPIITGELSGFYRKSDMKSVDIGEVVASITEDGSWSYIVTESHRTRASIKITRRRNLNSDDIELARELIADKIGVDISKIYMYFTITICGNSMTIRNKIR